MKMRAHHAYCSHFWGFDDPSRGEKFGVALNQIDVLLKEGKESVEIVDYPDFLCQVCSFFGGQECAHPRGGETGVKKWDSRILKGLGLNPCQVLTLVELKSLAQKKAPLNFCLTKCPYHLGEKCDAATFH